MKRDCVLLFAFLVVVYASTVDSLEDEDSSVALSSLVDDLAMDLKKKSNCKKNSDCEPTHICKRIKKRLKRCVKRPRPRPRPPQPCPPSLGPRSRPCSERCRCGPGQGPCRGGEQCRSGLRCLGEPDAKKCLPTVMPAKQGEGSEPEPEGASGNPDGPYDLVDQCSRNSECQHGHVCRSVYLHGSFGKRIRICVPRLAGALEDDDTAWEFFEDAAATNEDKLSEEFGLKKPKPKKCKKQSDCRRPFVCRKKHKKKKKGICVLPRCPKSVGPRVRPCTKRCKCGLGQGKCGSSSVCRPPLRCVNGKCVRMVIPKPKPKVTKPAGNPKTTQAAATPGTTQAATTPGTTQAGAAYKDDIDALNALSKSSKDVDSDDSLDVVDEQHRLDGF